jgi:hypothetical protein
MHPASMGLHMAEHTLFQSDDTSITPSTANFGHISFQVSNIVSVALSQTRRIRPIVIALALLAVAAVAIAIVTYERNPDQGLVAAAAGGILLLAAIIIQSAWPVWEFRLALRLSNGDSHPVVFNDRERAHRLKDAIEEAFKLRSLTPP